MRTTLVTGLAILLMTGCSWVKVEHGANSVRLVEASQVRDCERLGTTTTSVRSRVAGVERSSRKVSEELANLARNSAWEMGGDTIVADGPPDEGRQRFVVYRCRSHY